MKPGLIPSIVHIIGFGKDYILNYEKNFKSWRDRLGTHSEINLGSCLMFFLKMKMN